MTTPSPKPGPAGTPAADPLFADKKAFTQAIEPLLPALWRRAQHEHAYRRALGDFDEGAVSVEDLLAETLVQAWRRRHHKPAGLSLEAWLTALLHRAAERIARAERRYHAQIGLSLEAPLPPPPVYDDDEEFWEWYQPDEVLHWEDVLPDTGARDAETLMVPEEVRRMPAADRALWALLGVHRLSVAETAIILGREPKEIAARWAELRGRA